MASARTQHEQALIIQALRAHQQEMVACANHLLLNAHEFEGCPLCTQQIVAFSDGWEQGYKQGHAAAINQVAEGVSVSD